MAMNDKQLNEDRSKHVLGGVGGVGGVFALAAACRGL